MVATCEKPIQYYPTSKYRFVLTILITVLLLFVFFSIVSATTTPTLCDATPKYNCSKVTYTQQGSNVLITARNFKGAIDGGADRWQIYRTKDWERINGSWVFREEWGPGSWRTDVSFSPWFGWSNDDRTRINDSSVTFRFRFQEQGAYWCSELEQHNMLTNNSFHVLPAVCN